MQAEEVLFIGLDVDDKKYHGFAISPLTGEFHDFQCAPNVESLRKKLKSLSTKSEGIKICYEASYLGFSLCRSLRSFGYHCDVIAPSLIPEKRGRKVKTDRLDAEKLARLYLAQLLTIVHVPDETQEADRDLLRSRKFITEQMASVKKHINSLTRRKGWNFKTEEKGTKNWTVQYVRWLKVKIRDEENLVLKLNLEILMRQYESCSERIIEFDLQVEKLCSQDNYKEKTKALICYRGIDSLTALTLVTELGDVRRFKHPRQLTSYSGLDVIERSSGGHERKYGISKDGNRFIRTAVVEACQTVSLPVVVSRHIAKRRAGTENKYIEIADRCMSRLTSKSRRLLAKGKTRNKVKVACAREMLGFIWESLRVAEGNNLSKDPGNKAMNQTAHEYTL
jgi:transposase